jgi:glycosyltransferase involved in cell wall biosynthesis
MRIWLVQTGEEMPSDGAGTRLLRTCLLAGELAGRGHEVTYWNSTFNHQKKLQRYRRTTRIAQADGYQSVFLFGRPYRRNIGLGRILSQRDNAREFGRLAEREPRPDLVLCSLPTIECAAKATHFAKAAGVPAVVDCRDVWPEIIAERIPSGSKWLALPLLRAWERARDGAMRAATAITGVSDGFVDWGVAAAGRPRGQLDKAFHLATSPEPIPSDALEAARRYWLDRLGDMPSGTLVIAYAGTFSRRSDLETVFDGADLLTADERARTRIVLCGSGDLRSVIEARAATNPALVHAGWCTRPQLAVLMEKSAAGLLPYSNSPDFRITYPNKVGEYLTAGLPILTGVEGAIARLLEPHHLRLGYEAGSAASFAAAVRAMLSRTDLTELRGEARMVARAHFNPQEIYPRFADWLESIARAERKSR